MDRYDRLHRLYAEFDTDGLRAYRDLVDLFPAVDSPVALDYWQDARDALDERRAAVESSFADGEAMAEVATLATRDQAFTGLDVHATYGRAFDALVLDVDETLRSAGATDNEIPREVLHLLTEFHERGVAIVVCTGQTLENVKGFTIQGLGNRIVHSGTFSVVYESGTGVFTPGHGADTKRLLYERLDDDVRAVFATVRDRALADAPREVRDGCHLQGNEFNVTLKPNHEAGTDRARTVVDAALAHLLDLLGEAVTDATTGPTYARAHYADADPEIAAALARRDGLVDLPASGVPDPVVETFDRVDVAHYEADAAEISSLELDKAAGVEAALSVLGVDDPFVLVMGDSKTDLRVMEWVAARGAGVAAAPEHASESVLDHVRATDDLVFDRGDAAAMLRTALVVNVLDGMGDA
jgi:hydroxymethylpyrimidine pyrophosphatase-like HAD family hydrolase